LLGLISGFLDFRLSFELARKRVRLESQPNGTAPRLWAFLVFLCAGIALLGLRGDVRKK
jgi:hypothetical protein